MSLITQGYGRAQRIITRGYGTRRARVLVSAALALDILHTASLELDISPVSDAVVLDLSRLLASMDLNIKAPATLTLDLAPMGEAVLDLVTDGDP